jgi:Uri superfamily endonuclease
VKGCYVLLIKLPKARTITIGRLSDIHFPRGNYAYVGSALGGIQSRLSRYFNRNRKRHWHIDYLLEEGSVTGIVTGETEDKVECAVAQVLSSQFDSIPGFGSSDCHCHSHLFFGPEERQLKSNVVAVLESLDITPKSIKLRAIEND